MKYFHHITKGSESYQSYMMSCVIYHMCISYIHIRTYTWVTSECLKTSLVRRGRKWCWTCAKHCKTIGPPPQMITSKCIASCTCAFLDISGQFSPPKQASILSRWDISFCDDSLVQPRNATCWTLGGDEVCHTLKNEIKNTKFHITLLNFIRDTWTRFWPTTQAALRPAPSAVVRSIEVPPSSAAGGQWPPVTTGLPGEIGGASKVALGEQSQCRQLQMVGKDHVGDL